MSFGVNIKQLGHQEFKRYLCFSLSKENFAVSLMKVKEVVALPSITRVPHTPPHFLGIMNLRGQMISVFDLRIKFGFGAVNGPETTVIVCDFSPLCFGVVVDSVDAVLSLSQDAIKPKPDIESEVDNDYIAGVTKVKEKLILLLDMDRALKIKEHFAQQSSQSTKVS